MGCHKDHKQGKDKDKDQERKERVPSAMKDKDAAGKSIVISYVKRYVMLMIAFFYLDSLLCNSVLLFFPV